MESLEKINEQIERLYDVDDKLSTIILEASGRDSETKYTQAHLDLLEDLKALRYGLLALLNNHNDTVLNLGYALDK